MLLLLLLLQNSLPLCLLLAHLLLAPLLLLLRRVQVQLLVAELLLGLHLALWRQCWRLLELQRPLLRLPRSQQLQPLDVVNRLLSRRELEHVRHRD